jgi:hypothetical protein
MDTLLLRPEISRAWAETMINLEAMWLTRPTRWRPASPRMVLSVQFVDEKGIHHGP